MLHKVLHGLAAAAVAVVLGGSLGAAPAQATTYNFTFTGTTFGTSVITGQVTTDASDVATSISGYVFGASVGNGSITGLVTPFDPAYSSGSGWVADNVITGAFPYFSASQSSGLLFLYGSGLVGNLYYQPNDGKVYLSLGVAPNLGSGGIWNPGDPGVFELTEFTPSLGAPLPGALPLFASGLVGLGMLGWRRKRKNMAAMAAA